LNYALSALYFTSWRDATKKTPLTGSVVKPPKKMNGPSQGRSEAAKGDAFNKSGLGNARHPNINRCGAESIKERLSQGRSQLLIFKTFLKKLHIFPGFRPYQQL